MAIILIGEQYLRHLRVAAIRWLPIEHRAGRFSLGALCAFLTLWFICGGTVLAQFSSGKTEIEASTTLAKDSKTELLAQYQFVLVAIGTAAEHRKAAATYGRALQSAVQEANNIRCDIEALAPDPMAGLDVTAQYDADAIERELQQAKSKESPRPHSRKPTMARSGDA